jgi:deazaflavin-dependent oxidoreductase (nitroreductase family)
MPAARRNPLFELMFRVHPWIYRKTGGRLLGKLGPSPILLLTSRGRKTGEPRTNALMYLACEESWAVAASWAGEPKHPFWYSNLLDEHDVTLQIRDRTIAVTARDTQGNRARALVGSDRRAGSQLPRLRRTDCGHSRDSGRAVRASRGAGISRHSQV